MVHGAFCAGWAFDAFRKPFEAAGHPVACPDLPGHGAGGGSSTVTGRSMSDYAAAVRRVIDAQREPPILIGHSLGGLVAQMAARRARVAALILLAPSAPWGVTGSTAEEAISAVSLYALGPYWALGVEPDYPAARRYLFDRLPRGERRATFARMQPESGRALWETLNWWLDPFATTLVPARSVRAPVLAIVGGRDVIHPAATVRATTSRLGGETRVFPAMGHWLIGEPGWEDVAGACLDWSAGVSPALSQSAGGTPALRRLSDAA
jgi:pimeloyl-ACP methyl ester carboxylesterase